MFTSRQRSDAKTKVKSIYGKFPSAQGYCTSAAIGAVFSHHDCGVSLDCSTLYPRFCLGRYGGHCDLAHPATLTKTALGTSLAGRAGDDPAAGTVVYHSYRAAG